MRHLIILLTAAALVLSAPALANNGNGRGQGNNGNGPPANAGNQGNSGNQGQGNQGRGNSGGGSYDPADRVLDVLITAAEIAIFKEYLGRHDIPGYLANPKPLPPGIAMNLQRGKPLPPGIAKRYGLPGGLLSRLPRRDGYDWVVVGASILLVDAATQVIAEVLRDILLPGRGGY
jgi:hypothetical protein